MRFPILSSAVLALVLGACNGTITVPTDEEPGAATDEPGNPDNEPLPAVPMTTVDFEESNDDLVNPERGYYVGYNLVEGRSAEGIREEGHTLAIALVDLDDYRDRSLDSALLDALERGFAQVRAAGIKVILRFKYNSSFSDDAPRDRILQHIEQVTPLLRANADVISVMQAGFIGAWGEWHGSTNGLDNPEDRAAILDALLEALPPSRTVQVRRPIFKADFAGEGALDASEAFTDSPRARVGHHNDCFLASATDLGTYSSPVEEWHEYVENDTRFTPMGGETCRVYDPLTTCETAMAEMAAKHWSYLNLEYNRDVLAGWAEEGCEPEVARRLGYRFAIDRLTHNELVAPGGELGVEIQLHNSGFATPFNRRPVELVLSNGTTRHVVRLADVDARWWTPGDPHTLTVRLRVPADLAPGSYQLALRLPDEAEALADDPRYAIRLANDGAWDAATGDNVLTRALVVDPSAPGPVDPAATRFEQL